MWDHIYLWLNILVRWAHFMFGIAWIGASFYFMWLDYSLRKEKPSRPGVTGASWSVHGGGFYHVEKYSVAPRKMPEKLHWFIWDAYLTGITGFILLTLIYYIKADAYLIDTNKFAFTRMQAVTLSVGSLFVGWFIYDRLCRSPLLYRPVWLSLAVLALTLAATEIYAGLFTARAAFIHVGVLVGTIMVLNVWLVIIPNQRKAVKVLARGEQPDPQFGIIAKARSTHNHYLTLPVLLMMISNHYPPLYSHPQPALVIALIIALGASFRWYINRHDAGDSFKKIAWTIPVFILALSALVIITGMKPRLEGEIPSTNEALALSAKHCANCHAARPLHSDFDAPPGEVTLTSLDDLMRFRDKILEQSVYSDAMPLGNESGMTANERHALGLYLKSLN